MTSLKRRLAGASANACGERKGQQIRAWLALSFTVGLLVVVYVSLSLSVSADPLLMPLDDTYIHFQYAQQFARGEPMVYNPGDGATSGGTSLLYPPLLAFGYRLGFDGWDLSYWALAVGSLSFLGATWLVYQIGLANPLEGETEGISSKTSPYALAMAWAFAVSGPFVWASFSGMETAWFVLVVLLLFWSVQRVRPGWAVVAGLLTTLTRPEGVALSALGMLVLALRISWQGDWRMRSRRAIMLAFPVFAAGVQPLINLLATGDTASSGMQAKSILYNTGAPFSSRLVMILEFYARIWRELLSGYSPDYGTFTSPLLANVALAGLLLGVWLAWRNKRVNVAVLALVWVVVLTAGVSTLDTAFWQFKRYQLPAMALFYPAAAWTTSALGSVIERRSSVRWVRWILPALIVVPSLFTTWIFAQHYADNVRVVRDQQVKMAGWVRANLPEDARVGVHDVGLLRYFGDRSLYDMVGLTTDGPSVAWRQGPGAIYESMADSDSRPDFFAIYPDVQGLRYLLDAEVFGDVLAEFRVDLPASNVASATDYQAVYEADWSGTRDEERVAQDSALNYTAGMELVDQIDVANLDSEAAHGYQWDFGVELPGFVSEVYHLPYMACGGEGGDCWATDGVRVLGGSEQFALETRPGEDLLLVTRVHGRSPVALTVRINDRWQSSRVQPAVPGRWVEVVTLIPGDVITSRETHVDIAPAITDLNSAEGAYRPAYHWAFQGDFARELSNETPVATFGSGDEVELLGYALTPNLPGEIRVNLNWQLRTGVLGDSLLFLHLYDDIDAPPVAQVVSRSGNGALPPGNWLPGLVEDDLTVALPEELAPGVYTVALGLFDAVTGERYPVNGPGAISDRRLFIGEITIKE